jgi:hypothetical protein
MENGSTIPELKTRIIRMGTPLGMTKKDFPLWKFIWDELCNEDPTLDDFIKIRDMYQKTIEYVENKDWH